MKKNDERQFTSSVTFTDQRIGPLSSSHPKQYSQYERAKAARQYVQYKRAIQECDFPTDNDRRRSANTDLGGVRLSVRFMKEAR